MLLVFFLKRGRFFESFENNQFSDRKKGDHHIFFQKKVSRVTFLSTSLSLRQSPKVADKLILFSRFEFGTLDTDTGKAVIIPLDISQWEDRQRVLR